MAYNLKKEIDFIDWKILKELQQNGRIPFSELSKKVSLSRPAITERVRRLEEAGIITGYHARIDFKTLGYPLAAYLKVSIDRGYYQEVVKRIQQIPEVIECYRIAGDDDLIVKIVSSSIEYFAEVIDSIVEVYPSCNFVTFIIMESLSDFDLLKLQPIGSN